MVVVVVVVAVLVAVLVPNPNILTIYYLLTPAWRQPTQELVTIYYSPLTTHYSLLTTHYSPARRRPATARGAPCDRVHLHHRLHRRVGTGPAQMRPRFRLRRL